MGEAFLGSFGALRADPPEESWLYPRAGALALPDEVMLPIPTDVQDQGSLGSCTGQAFGKALEILDGRGIEFSALGIYYNNRIASGFPAGEDTGAFMDPSVRALASYGAGSESLWPYDVSMFAHVPGRRWREQALDHRVTHWFRATDAQRLRTALAAGSPVVGAFEVPPDFAQTGETGLWHDRGGSALGGHAVCFVGYKDGMFKIQNSWSDRWGDEGHFWLPYSAFDGPRWYDAIVIEKYDSVAGG